MPQNNLDIKPSSIYTNLVTFTWGTLVNTARYIAGNRNATISGDVFTALPQLDIDLKKQTGGAKDESIEIRSTPVPPLNDMLLGTPFAPVTVLVEEIDIRNLNTRRTLFKGRIIKITGNKNGRDDQVEITVGGSRHVLSAPLGIPALNTCAWNFGDKNCGIDLASVRVVTNITAISGNTITIDNLSNPAGWYFRGYVEVDGLRISVRQQDTIDELILVDAPPAIWLDAIAVLTPGCDKIAATCQDKWDNIENFGGFGIAIPTYHPVFETQ